MSKRALAGLVAASLSATLMLTGTASADDIDVAAAQKRVNRYAQRIVDDPKKPYVFANVSCRRAFRDHNHYARCDVRYDTPETRAEEARRQAEWVCPIPPRTPCGPRRPKRIAPWACSERLEVYLRAHRSSGSRGPFMRTAPGSAVCGTKLLGPSA